jgi:hypothetical protein
MLTTGGSRFDQLYVKGSTFYSETLDAVGQMFYGSNILTIPNRTRNGACKGVDLGRPNGSSECLPFAEGEHESTRSFGL